jgi:hypothetical protein
MWINQNSVATATALGIAANRGSTSAAPAAIAANAASTITTIAAVTALAAINHDRGRVRIGVGAFRNENPSSATVRSVRAA